MTKRLKRLQRIIHNHKKATIIWFIMSFLVSVLVSSIIMQSISHLGGYIQGTDKLISFNPIKIFYYGLFTTLGLICTFALYLILNFTAFYVLIVLRDVKETDDRGIKQSDSGTHGTAQAADIDTIYEYMEEADLTKCSKTIMGLSPLNNKPLVLKDSIDKKLNGMEMLVGGSGRMKTRAMIMNKVLQGIMSGISLVITDPKGEIYRKTAKVGKKFDYKIKVINIKNPKKSDSINLLTEIGNEISSVQTFVETFIANTGGKQDIFWDNAATNMMTALALYVVYDEKRPDRSVGAIYEIITRKKTMEICAMFNALEKVKINGERHPALDNYHFFKEQSEEKKNSILEGIGLRMQIFQDPDLRRMVSTDDVSLTLPGKEKCIYYIIMEDRTRRKDMISSLFFTFLFDRLVTYADNQENECLPVPVRVIFDEMANIGHIVNFDNWITETRSRRLYFTCCFQDLGQLIDNYSDKGEHVWSTIKGNCDLDIYYGSNDIEVTATHYSKLAGKMTEDVSSIAEGKEAFSLNATQSQYRETLMQQAREVYLPDEVKALPEDECLIFLKATNKSFRLKKMDYTLHPLAEEIELVHVKNYAGENTDELLVDESTAKKKPKQEPKKDNANAKPKLMGSLLNAAAYEVKEEETKKTNPDTKEESQMSFIPEEVMQKLKPLKPLSKTKQKVPELGTFEKTPQAKKIPELGKNEVPAVAENKKPCTAKSQAKSEETLSDKEKAKDSIVQSLKELTGVDIKSSQTEKVPELGKNELPTNASKKSNVTNLSDF